MSTELSSPVVAKPATFALPVRIYWEDTDAGGIVYHANYLKFFERARSEWLRAQGLHQQALRNEQGGGFVVTDMQIKFISAARLDDELLATCTLQSAARASLLVHQRLIRASDAADALTAPALCEATVRIGWVNLEHMRPGRLPAQLLEQLQP